MEVEGFGTTQITYIRQRSEHAVHTSGTVRTTSSDRTYRAPAQGCRTMTNVDLCGAFGGPVRKSAARCTVSDIPCALFRNRPTNGCPSRLATHVAWLRVWTTRV